MLYLKQKIYIIYCLKKKVFQILNERRMKKFPFEFWSVEGSAFDRFKNFWNT